MLEPGVPIPGVPIPGVPMPGVPMAGNDARREVILTAARTCFVRAGFHRATIQDVARAAGMSPGNIYRYFASKEALVEGMCQQDKQAMRGDFAKLRADADMFAVMTAVLRHHLVEEPRERFILLMEIWAEAARNPQLEWLHLEVDAQVRAELRQFIAHAHAAALVAPDLDVEFAINVLLTLITGLFRRRALEVDFDGEKELKMALAVCGAVLAGSVTSPYVLSSPQPCSQDTHPEQAA